MNATKLKHLKTCTDFDEDLCAELIHYGCYNYESHTNIALQ